eukprot:360182-Chlamydomonas_euryale.AAC.6
MCAAVAKHALPSADKAVGARLCPHSCLYFTPHTSLPLFLCSLPAAREEAVRLQAGAGHAECARGPDSDAGHRKGRRRGL